MFARTSLIGRLLLAAAVLIIAALLSQPAKAETSQSMLSFEFTSAPDYSQIYALNVVPFTLEAHNNSDKSKSGQLYFPSWVRLGAASNQHLWLNKAGELTWSFTLKPHESRTLTVRVVVTTAWHRSSCFQGSWPFMASLYSDFAPVISHEICYYPQKGGSNA